MYSIYFKSENNYKCKRMLFKQWNQVRDKISLSEVSSSKIIVDLSSETILSASF